MASLEYQPTLTFEFPGDLIGVAVIGHYQHPVNGVPADSEPRDGDFHLPAEVDGQGVTVETPDTPAGRWHVWVRSVLNGEQITTRVGSYIKD